MKALSIALLAGAFAFSGSPAHANNYVVGQQIAGAGVGNSPQLAFGGTLVLSGIDDAGSGRYDQPRRAIFAVMGGSAPMRYPAVLAGKDLMIPTISNGYLGSILLKVQQVYPNGHITMSIVYTRVTP